MDNIIYKKKHFQNKIKIFDDYVYDLLILIIELPIHSDIDKVKLHLNMQKSSFLGIITNKESVFEVNDVMYIIHSKLYLLLTQSKQILRKIILLFMTNQLSINDIYQAYDEHFICNSKQIDNFLLNFDLKIENNEDILNSTDHFHDNICDKNFFMDKNVNSRNSEILNYFSIESQERYNLSANSSSTKYQQKCHENFKNHPLDEYLIYFCDFVYHFFKFCFFDINNNFMLTLQSGLAAKHAIFISTDSFFNGLESHKKAKTFNMQQFDDNSNLILFSFLEYFKQKFYYSHFRLGYNSEEIIVFFDHFIEFIHPKSIFLNITKFYTYSFYINSEKKNEFLTEKLNILIQMILNKVFFVHLQIDTFGIEIRKSRIFDITDMNIISNASFSPALHTSICFLQKPTNSLMQMVFVSHLNTYISKKHGILEFLKFEDGYTQIEFTCSKIIIDNFHVIKSTGINDIIYMSAIIEADNCIIETKNSSDMQIKKNIDSTTDNKIGQINDDPISSTSQNSPYYKICESNFKLKINTSFRVFVLHFMLIKSKSKTSYVSLSKVSYFKLFINNCKIDFQFPTPSSIKTIEIKNSICENSYSCEDIKHKHNLQNNTNILIKHCYLIQNRLLGIYKKILIHGCNKVLSISAQFEIIEICGIFEKVEIFGEFRFHFKTEKFATFLFIKKRKYLKANNVKFVDNVFLSFIESHFFEECEINSNIIKQK